MQNECTIVGVVILPARGAGYAYGTVKSKSPAGPEAGAAGAAIAGGVLRMRTTDSDRGALLVLFLCDLIAR